MLGLDGVDECSHDVSHAIIIGPVVGIMLGGGRGGIPNEDPNAEGLALSLDRFKILISFSRDFILFISSVCSAVGSLFSSVMIVSVFDQAGRSIETGLNLT